MEKILVDPDLFRDKSRSVPLLNEYKAIRKELEELLFKWEQNQDKLEATKRELNAGEIGDGY